MLTDTFGRNHTYLRISLTDKCNFRCTYCMPEENMKFLPNKELMSADEIYGLAKVFTDLGVNKIRLTGGEPTLRKDLPQIVRNLHELNTELSITSNGLLLSENLDLFRENGIRKINISLDTIRHERFKQLTRRDHLERVLSNIDEAVSDGFKLRVNAVIMKDRNDDEMVELLEWAAAKGVEMRFIEYMPFFGNQWSYEQVVSQKEILNRIREHYVIEPVKTAIDSTAAVYNISGLNSRFGIIPTISNPFCNGCSRIRLTADGKVKNCLFADQETDLLTTYRQGEDVTGLIQTSILNKKKSAAGKIDFSHEQARLEYAKNRAMVSIGG